MCPFPRQSTRFAYLQPLGRMLKIAITGSGIIAISCSTLPEASSQPKFTYRQPLEQIKLTQPCISQDLALQPFRPSLSSDQPLMDTAAYYGCDR